MGNDAKSKGTGDGASPGEASTADEKGERKVGDMNPEEVLQIFKRGAEFTEELLKENERLRYKVAQLETQHGGEDTTLIRELVDKVARLEEERLAVNSRFEKVERANRDYAQRFEEVEEENNKLLNLFIVSYQIHATLQYDEVLRTVAEVILNFMGADAFSVAVIDGSKLRSLVSDGINEADLGKVSATDGIIGDCVNLGRPYFVDRIEGKEVNLEAPLACAPLQIKEQVLGVILLYSFLQQKTELSNVDHEVLKLLAAHAATAIVAAKLYTEATSDQEPGAVLSNLLVKMQRAEG